MTAHSDKQHATGNDHPEGWFAALKLAGQEAGKDNAGLVSAGVAYYTFLAIVPLLAASVLVYGLVVDAETVARHAQAIAGALPQSAASLITDQLESVTETEAGKKGLGLLLALAVALFGARNGAGSVMLALDIAYDLEDRRSFLKRNLLALLITLGAILGFALVGGAVAATGLLDGFIGKLASYVVICGAGIGGALLLYRYAPDRNPPEWHHQLPGAVFFGVVWMVLTILFGIYVANFGNYNATYGSLGAVVVLLTWLYLTAYVLLIGAELNAPAERDNRKGVAESDDG